MSYTQAWDHMQGQVHDGMIQRDEDGAFIPFDPDNVDYQDYLAWLDEGNQPNPCVPPAQPENPIEDVTPTIDELAAQVYDQDQRIAALETIAKTAGYA
jgi:hypothetical protein